MYATMRAYNRKARWMTYAVSEPVRTLLAESNWWLHVTQHVVHVRVVNSPATTTHSIILYAKSLIGIVGLV